MSNGMNPYAFWHDHKLFPKKLTDPGKRVRNPISGKDFDMYADCKHPANVKLGGDLLRCKVCGLVRAKRRI